VHEYTPRLVLDFEWSRMSKWKEEDIGGLVHFECPAVTASNKASPAVNLRVLTTSECVNERQKSIQYPP